jgi:hypothetical protein
MTDPLIAELRAAAAQARAIAALVIDPGTRQGFLDFAAKWETEAAALELKPSNSSDGSLATTSDPE